MVFCAKGVLADKRHAQVQLEVVSSDPGMSEKRYQHIDLLQQAKMFVLTSQTNCHNRHRIWVENVPNGLGCEGHVCWCVALTSGVDAAQVSTEQQVAAQGNCVPSNVMSARCE